VKAEVLVGGFDSTRLRRLTKDGMRAKARGVISATDRVLEAPS
jgi:hypothetical protein